MNSGPNTRYYKDQADYDGIVMHVQQELRGLTVENYSSLYISICKRYYSVINKKNRTVFPSFSAVANGKNKGGEYRMLLARRLSRLYPLLRLGMVQHELSSSYAGLLKAHEVGARHQSIAPDRELVLAHRLRSNAMALAGQIDELKAARAGLFIVGLGVLKDFFQPEVHSNLHSAQKTALRIAHITLFQTALNDFDALLKLGTDSIINENYIIPNPQTYTNTPLEKRTRIRIPKGWSHFLTNGFDEDCLRKLANKLNLINDDGEPTEEANQSAWVAIIDALRTTGYMPSPEAKPLQNLLKTTFPGARTPAANTIGAGRRKHKDWVNKIYTVAKNIAPGIVKEHNPTLP